LFTTLKEIYNKKVGEVILAIFNYNALIIIETDISDFTLRV
jgi:hypothetical protein